jgi:uncharacterized protein YrrD
MLQQIKELYGDKLAAVDGDIGRVRDVYFDDKTWVVRYVVADTGSWLKERLVLLSPHAFGKLSPHAKALNVKLTRRQIEDSPSIESHKPISRDFEIEYHRYYGWPAYWNDGRIWGGGGHPKGLPPSKDVMEVDPKRRGDDEHLRSTRAMTGYHIQTTDGVVGHVSDFLVDDISWAVLKLAVAAGHWYSGKEVLISTSKVRGIHYEESTVFVNLTREDIEKTARSGIAPAEPSRS